MHNVKIDKQVSIIFYKIMRRSREYARDYSTEWIELLVILIILTILAVAMYFSFRYDPNHTITETSKNNTVVSVKGQSKSAIKSSIQKSVHMVSVESVPITKVPIRTVPIKVVESDASKIRTLGLTPVRDKPKVELTQMRVQRSIRRIPETK